MKTFITTVLLFIAFNLSAETYYVAPTGGSDSNPGTISQPWATWQKAFTTPIAGDTVYFRGGVWYPTDYAVDNSVVFVATRNVAEVYEGTIYGHDGTQENPICFFAYPSDYEAGNYPILDCSLVDTVGHSFNTGLSLTFAQWYHIKGLTVRNVYQPTNGNIACGIGADFCSNMIFENMVSTHIGGRGYTYWGVVGYYGVATDTVRYINCDASYCYDPFSLDAGNGGDGWKTQNEPGSFMSWDRCRAWNCSDDGIDPSGSCVVEIKNCWSWKNGGLGASLDGNGFKSGGVLDSVSVPTRYIHNNLAAYNSGYGYYDLEFAGLYRNNARVWNNTIYHNGLGIQISENAEKPGSLSVYNNNIVYATQSLDAGGRPYNLDVYDYYSESHNTWDYGIEGSLPRWVPTDTVTVTDADFVSVDSTGLSGPRQADGSLPVLSFLKLADGSDLIDAGRSDIKDVGEITYNGSSPDLGYSESEGYIIADHRAVDRFDDIPAYYISEVKKMLVWFPGESHSAAYRDGLDLLEATDATYNATVAWGYPSVSTTALRSAGWPMDQVGEARWFTWKAYTSNPPADKDVIKDLIIGQVNASNPIHLVGFAWCWDMVFGSPTANADPTLGVHWYGETDGGPDGNKAWGLNADDYTQTTNRVSLDTYLEATEDYITYCANNSPLTDVAFTTGPVDHYAATGEGGYQVYLKHEAIRDYVRSNGKILFDYADILCYDDGASTPNTTTWNGHTYPIITTTNGATEDTGHITEEGAIRIAKAQWYLLARLAGWDDLSASDPQIDSTLTDILTFTLPTQTGAATINTTNHTVAIEVNHLATVTNLTPYISLSSGATISPASMVSRDFTTPQTYTVTALDGTTTQAWVVTVTKAEEPVDPPTTSSSKIVKLGGFILKL